MIGLRRRLFACLVVLGLLGSLPLSVDAGNSQFFPQTGQSSSNAFYDFWLAHGQTEILGLPLSPAYINKESRIVQVYERAVMEWHPENSRENRVQLRRLGDIYLNTLENATTHEKTGDTRRHTSPRGCAAVSNCETFPITSHTVLGAFRDYWYASGGLATFGLPLTEEYNACGTDDGNCTGHFSAQVFERNVFEWHPEVQGGIVLLRRIGAAVDWTDAVRASIADNPNSIRSVPDYDDVGTSNTSPPQVPSNSAPQPTTAPVYYPPPQSNPQYQPPAANTGPVSGSNGACPAGYPIKANDNSGIYHVPGQQFYNATNARNCFATEAAAQAAGYRPSKV